MTLVASLFKGFSITFHYLGEQLLTEVKALLKSKLRRARASILGVWHILFIYDPSSKPPSSAKKETQHLLNAQS